MNETHSTNPADRIPEDWRTQSDSTLVNWAAFAANDEELDDILAELASRRSRRTAR